MAGGDGRPAAIRWMIRPGWSWPGRWPRSSTLMPVTPVDPAVGSGVGGPVWVLFEVVVVPAAGADHSLLSPRARSGRRGAPASGSDPHREARATGRVAGLLDAAQWEGRAR